MSYEVINSDLNNGKVQSLFAGLSQTLVYAMIGGAVIGLVGRALPAFEEGVDNTMNVVGTTTSYVGIPFDWLADTIGGE